MLVLYDLQEEIKNMKAGALPEDKYIAPCGDVLPTLSIVEAHGAKSVMVSNRAECRAGVYFHLPVFAKAWPGDRITITGRIAHNTLKGNWAMILDRFSMGKYTGMTQHSVPKSDGLFSLTYLIDTADLQCPICIQSSFWGDDIPLMDFFIDSILITRSLDNMDTVIDDRKTVYSLADDEIIQNMKPGTVSGYLGDSYLRRAGEPEYTMIEHDGRNGIHVTRRSKDWDALDIPVPALKFMPNNCYEITVKGRMDGAVPDGTLIMLQTMPGFIWRDPQGMADNREFTLTHTLTTMEVHNADIIRITTNSAGEAVSFFVYDIEIIVKPLQQLGAK